MPRPRSTNDLINADSLEQIKWVFDSTKVDASKLAANKSSLLNQLEKSLNALSKDELGVMALKYEVAPRGRTHEVGIRQLTNYLRCSDVESKN